VVSLKFAEILCVQIVYVVNTYHRTRADNYREVTSERPHVVYNLTVLNINLNMYMHM
jgi:hypothetical protein